MRNKSELVGKRICDSVVVDYDDENVYVRDMNGVERTLNDEETVTLSVLDSLMFFNDYEIWSMENYYFNGATHEGGGEINVDFYFDEDYKNGLKEFFEDKEINDDLVKKHTYELFKVFGFTEAECNEMLNKETLEIEYKIWYKLEYDSDPIGYNYKTDTIKYSDEYICAVEDYKFTGASSNPKVNASSLKALFEGIDKNGYFDNVITLDNVTRFISDEEDEPEYDRDYEPYDD